LGVTVRRTLNATFLNSVANDPDVRPWLGGQGQIDLTAVVANPLNIALVTDHGGWIATPHDGLTYELHTLFLRRGRGAVHLAAAAEGLTYVFTHTPCREIVTKIPQDNRGAALFSGRMGFRRKFYRVNAIHMSDKASDVSYEGLTIDDWAMSSVTTRQAGEAFHRQLEAADLGLPPHPEDESHDYAAGAAYLMMAAGNAHKGAWFYNRWAALAGYEPIRLLGETPLLVDIGQGVMVTNDAGRMEIVECRSAL
jgi:hypothetical protein